jgi:glucose/arabinose dehydrogenase
MRDFLRAALPKALALLLVCHGASAHADSPLAKIKLKPGFKISYFAQKVPNARSLTLGKDGTVYVGTREDKVYALPDRDHNGQADQVIELASGLKQPNGVAYHDGSLYVAEINRILRFDDVAKHLSKHAKYKVVYDQLPKDEHHGWKFIAFGPDGWLYVPIGMPCNTCERSGNYGTLMRMHPDGTGLELFARGIRNTVGFDWSPENHELWFTDNGRDNLGDDVPPDELNHAPKKDMDFGFPYCHGNAIADPELNGGKNCSEFTPPALELGPHVASLGMRFYTGRMFPSEFRNQVFIAEHGSWNRSTPLGYRVTLAKKQTDGTLKYETFADGWFQTDGAWGRPVDVLAMPDGALLVSDDKAGAVYRITYSGPGSSRR